MNLTGKITQNTRRKTIIPFHYLEGQMENWVQLKMLAFCSSDFLSRRQHTSMM